MFLYTLFNIVVTLLFLIALGYLGFRLFAWKQGDEQIVMIPKRRTPLMIEDISFNSVVLTTDIPFTNKGRQNGTIMDLYPRHLLPQEQFDNVHIESWTTDLARPRHDGYWEAVIIEPRKGGMIRLHLIMTAKSGNIRTDMKDMPTMHVDIVYQVVGRSDWHIAKNRITISAQELAEAMRQ